MKIVNKKKFVRNILIIVGTVVIISLNLASTSLSHKEVSKKVIYVSSGDTLWSIAEYEQENNEYYRDFEIREIIYEIRKINNLNTNANLKVGQALMINEI